MAIREALDKLLANRDLTAAECSAALEDVIFGDVPDAQIAAFLVALRMKGETASEVAGLARTMRENAVPVRTRSTGLVDVCGTGGSGAGTANISTTVTFVLAGAGLPVAKHGNRSATRKSGSADVLEALGVPLDLDAKQVATCIDDAGVGFIFAPAFHPAMAKVMPVRRALAFRTIFNVVAPLTNPARPQYQLIGVGAEPLVGIVAGALAELGVERAIVVHGAGGADELTCVGEATAVLVEGGETRSLPLSPADAGLDTSPLEALRGGEPDENAVMLRSVLEGKPSEIADCVLFNAAVAFMAAGRVEGPRAGVELARDVISDGRAIAALERLLSVTSSF